MTSPLDTPFLPASLSLEIFNVMKPCCPVSRDLLTTVAERFEIAARQAAMMLAGSSPDSSKPSAACWKWALVSMGTLVHASALVFAAAASAAAAVGGPVRSNLKPWPRLLSILITSPASRGVNSRMLVPLLPARPVLPLL
jgi:hypothetical protein